MFLVGKDGDFDQIVASAVKRAKRIYRDDNSALTLCMPYPTEALNLNMQSYRAYYDEINVYNLMKRYIPKLHTNREIEIWLTEVIWWFSM